jgi:hypothetical protein
MKITWPPEYVSRHQPTLEGDLEYGAELVVALLESLWSGHADEPVDAQLGS